MNIYTTNDQQLLDAGAKPYYLGTGWMWYARIDGSYDGSHVDVSRIDSALTKSALEDQSRPLMIDIEAFDLIGDRDFAIRQLTVAAKRIKSAQPDRIIGFYRLVPERSYWAPVNGSYAGITQWMDRNTANARDLLPLVDVVYPSIYSFYSGQMDAWKEYAGANLAEAMRVCGGLPVYPVLMPTMHSTTEPIDPDEWATMVEFCASYPGISGLMMHTSSVYVVDENWRESVLTQLSISL